ncbi:MAG: hypothetical protein M1829_004914 [Trizodia sp. TS-e1964]|nr:MAG: hypothetical protein M1829_004914 [Trizodia sp. TS-e1964]
MRKRPQRLATSIAAAAWLWLSTLPLLSQCADPAAFPVPVSSKWYGYDGMWSAPSIQIRVGQPQKWIDVLVSTASQETWVIGPGGCDSSALCAQLRGGLFYPNSSSTWQPAGYFELGLDPNLGFGGNAEYGFDSLYFKDWASLPGQIIGVLNTTDYWLGFMGLGVKPSNFSTNIDHLSTLSTFVENQSLIPSHSFGFTSGAHYRLKSVPCSLTLGGYDSNRFEPHDVSFQLDPSQLPVASVNQITVSASPLSSSTSQTNWSTNPLTLLTAADAALMTIDSSTPFLWLPESVCKRFETALGLKYNATLNLYTFGSNDSIRETLINWNLTFTVTLSDLPSSTTAVNITLPYAAFDYTLTYPFPALNGTFSDPPKNYFPLRKAANSTQYTLGRVFLQESYLIVDYERNNFSVHQAKFSSDALTNINLVDISRPEHSVFTGPATSASKKPLSTGVLIGIAAGGAVILVSLVMAAWFCIRRRRRFQENDADTKKRSSTKAGRLSKLFSKPARKSELDSGVPASFPTEIGDGNEIIELPAATNSIPAELAGSDSYETSKGAYRDYTPYQESQRRKYSDNQNLLQPDIPSYPLEKDDDVSEYNSTARSPPLSPVPAYVSNRDSKGLTSPTNSQGFATAPGYSAVSNIAPLSPSVSQIHRQDGQVFRSNSRGSRFTEDTIGEMDDRSQHRRGPTVPQRYSWEAE